MTFSSKGSYFVMDALYVYTVPHLLSTIACVVSCSAECIMTQATHTSLCIALTVHMLRRVFIFYLREWQECRLYCCSGNILYFFSRMQKKKICNGHKNFSVNVKKLIFLKRLGGHNILQT